MQLKEPHSLWPAHLHPVHEAIGAVTSPELEDKDGGQLLSTQPAGFPPSSRADVLPHQLHSCGRGHPATAQCGAAPVC